VTAAALARMGSRAASRLIEALRHANPGVRRYAARLLGKNPRGRDAAPALAGLAHRPRRAGPRGRRRRAAEHR